MRAKGHGASDAGDVLLEPFFFWSTVPGWGRIARHKFLADSDFPFVGQAREAHRNAGEVALGVGSHIQDGVGRDGTGLGAALAPIQPGDRDRKSTRLNSSHLVISYAVFCLKKKNKNHIRLTHLLSISFTPISFRLRITRQLTY